MMDFKIILTSDNPTLQSITNNNHLRKSSNLSKIMFFCFACNNSSLSSHTEYLDQFPK